MSAASNVCAIVIRSQQESLMYKLGGGNAGRFCSAAPSYSPSRGESRRISAQNEDLYVELRVKHHSYDGLNSCYQKQNINRVHLCKVFK